MRRTRNAKIVATLGPASSDPAIVRRLFIAGIDVFRRNFSHGEHADHQLQFETLRALEQETGRPIGILADLPVPSCVSAHSPMAPPRWSQARAFAWIWTRHRATHSASRCRIPRSSQQWLPTQNCCSMTASYPNAWASMYPESHFPFGAHCRCRRRGPDDATCLRSGATRWLRRVRAIHRRHCGNALWPVGHNQPDWYCHGVMRHGTCLIASPRVMDHFDHARNANGKTEMVDRLGATGCNAGMRGGILGSKTLNDARAFPDAPNWDLSMCALANPHGCQLANPSVRCG